MKRSIEFAVEEFFIALLRRSANIPGKIVVHFDEDRIAEDKAIVVSAKAGNRSRAAFGGSDLEVNILYRSPIGTSSNENDLTAATLRSAIDESGLSQNVLHQMRTSAKLSDILITDEWTGERENTDNLRNRSVTIRVQARLI